MYIKFSKLSFKTRILIFIFISCLAGTATAGQGWYVTINNKGSALAGYAGMAGSTCWYPSGFESSFEIPINAPVHKYTEEKWAIFDNCGGNGHIIGLKFVNSAHFLGYIYVSLGDFIPAGAKGVQCTGELGHAAYLSWKWLDGSKTTPPNPVISCSAKDSGTVNATINIP